MKKKQFYLFIVLSSLTSGNLSFIHATDYEEKKFSSLSPPRSSSMTSNPGLCSDFERDKLYNETFPKKDSRSVTKAFRKEMSRLISDNNNISKEIKELKNVQNVKKSLENKVDQNKERLTQYQDALSLYQVQGLDADQVVNFLKSHKEELEKIYETSEDEQTKVGTKYCLEEIKKQIENLDIPKEKISIENVFSQSFNAKNSLLFSNNWQAEQKLKKLQDQYNQLSDLKLKTTYVLPEVFKQGYLIDSSQLLNLLGTIGIEENVIKQIHGKNFLKFCVRCLELPNPQLKNVNNTIEGYISHIDKLTELYAIRLKEDAFNFIHFTDTLESIGEQSPYKEKEEEITKKIMISSIVPEYSTSSQGRDYVPKIFAEINYRENAETLLNLINKAVPNHSLALLQLLCASLDSYEGASFLDSKETPFPVKAAEKILKGVNQFDEEFFRSRNRLVRNKFNLEVLKVIKENFEKSLLKDSSVSSEEDQIL